MPLLLLAAAAMLILRVSLLLCCCFIRAMHAIQICHFFFFFFSRYFSLLLPLAALRHAYAHVHATPRYAGYAMMMLACIRHVTYFAMLAYTLCCLR